MARVYLPVPLRKLAEGQESIPIAGDSVRAVLDDLAAQYPALKTSLFDARGQLTRFVGIFVNGEDYRVQGGEGCALTENDRIELLLPIAGG